MLPMCGDVLEQNVDPKGLESSKLQIKIISRALFFFFFFLKTLQNVHQCVAMFANVWRSSRPSAFGNYTNYDIISYNALRALNNRKYDVENYKALRSNHHNV